MSAWKHFSSVERLSSEPGQRSISVLCWLKPDQSLLVRKASSSKLVIGKTCFLPIWLLWRLFRAALCILDGEEPGLAGLLYQQKAVLHVDAL